MIGYTLVGSNRLEDAKTFYDALFQSIGVNMMFDHPSGGRLYGEGFESPFFGVVGPFDEKPATAGNGTMTSLKMESRAAVEEFHKVALSLGGANEGDPGIRGDESIGFYGAYFRDLDGNKLCAFHIG